jgi:hypothetical protein
MIHKFRLTFAAKKGVFNFDESSREFDLAPSKVATLSARNSEKLRDATTLHIDVGGFESEASAKTAGEAFRIQLRLANVLLNLGINVPVKDGVSARVSDEIKEKLKLEQGVVVVDTIWGLSVFPEDGRHFEYVVAGSVDVKPADPTYIFSAIQALWPLTVILDSASEVSLHILNLAAIETSDKAAFLTSYLALEPVIERRSRSSASIKLIQSFQRTLEKSTKRKRLALEKGEVDSLIGALKALHEESFSSALTRFSKRLSKPTQIRGLPTQKFISACIDTRNRLSHNAEPKHDVRLSELTAGIRELVLALVWERSKLPSFTFNIPPSSVSIPPGGLSVRVM